MSNTLSPPTTVITPTNHGGLITITAAVGLTFALCSMLIRVYARMAINGPWSHDDTALAVSTVSEHSHSLPAWIRPLMTFDSDLVCGTIDCKNDIRDEWLGESNSLAQSVQTDSSGKGKLIDRGPSRHVFLLIHATQSDYASDLLYILAIYFSKVSAVYLFLRLTPNKQHVRFCYGILGTSTIWVVASIFMLALRCHLSQPWVNDEHCVNIVRFFCMLRHILD